MKIHLHQTKMKVESLLACLLAGQKVRVFSAVRLVAAFSSVIPLLRFILSPHMGSYVILHVKQTTPHPINNILKYQFSGNTWGKGAPIFNLQNHHYV